MSMPSEKSVQSTRRRLLSGKSPSQKGIWRIRGEDANADWGGPHVLPDLGLVEGTYEEAVDYALGLKRFFTWGVGGSIEPYELPEVKKLDAESVRRDRVAKLEAEKSELEGKIRQICQELANLS